MDPYCRTWSYMIYRPCSSYFHSNTVRFLISWDEPMIPIDVDDVAWSCSTELRIAIMEVEHAYTKYTIRNFQRSTFWIDDTSSNCWAQIAKFGRFLTLLGNSCRNGRTAGKSASRDCWCRRNGCNSSHVPKYNTTWAADSVANKFCLIQYNII